MIKAVLSTNRGKNILLLGLSHANLRQLRKDRPIMVDSAALGLPEDAPDVLLMAGETEDEIQKELESRMGAFPKVEK